MAPTSPGRTAPLFFLAALLLSLLPWSAAAHRAAGDDAAAAADRQAFERAIRQPHRPRTPEGDTRLDGFPVWLAKDGRLDRIVVAVEGFDPYNQIRASDWMILFEPAARELRAAGISILMVDFPDSHLAPDALAPLVSRAIRSAAAASGHEVAVAGLCAGGIASRWALVDAEQRGAPLPVHTFLSLDSPNRGVHISPALLALTARYGQPQHRKAMSSPAARAILDAVPRDVAWKRVGLRGVERAVPAGWALDRADHQAFYDRLRRLNARGGYPARCRTVAVASGSRAPREQTGRPPALLHLWLPFGQDWTMRPEPEDRAPGSLLPPFYAAMFSVREPLGVAGSYLRSLPTFLPTASALDAAPGEQPPFDAWYARPDDLPPIPHDQLDPGSVAFAVRELLNARWPAVPAGRINPLGYNRPCECNTGPNGIHYRGRPRCALSDAGRRLDPARAPRPADPRPRMFLRSMDAAPLPPVPAR